MVKLTGSYEFDASREAVWEALLDPDVLSRILPGCERLEKTSDNQYRGEISIRIGPVQGTFQGNVNLMDIDPPNKYRMELAGQGRPGFVKGSGTLHLEGDRPTTLHYGGEAQLSGRIARVAQRLVDSTARSLTRQGLQSLDKTIEARLRPPTHSPGPSNNGPAPQVADNKTPPPATPSTMEVGVNVAKDVATDLAQDIQTSYSGRDILIILAGLAAILWMWRQLFAKKAT